MNATPRNATVNPVATTFACAGSLLNAAQVMLRRLGYTEVGNDSLSCVVADLSRIESVLIGRANGAQNGAPAPVVAPSPAVSMPAFVHPASAEATYAAMTAPVALPVDAPEFVATQLPDGSIEYLDPPTPNDDDDEFDGPNTVECDDDTSTAEVCGKCKGKGTWRFGRPCPDCSGDRAPVGVSKPAPVATVAANKPVAPNGTAMLPTHPVNRAPAADDDVPVIGYDDVPEGYTIRVQQPIMRNGKPLHVVEFDDEQLYDDYSPTKALAFAQKHAIDAGRCRRASKPAPTPMSQKPPAQPALRQGNSSAPLNAPAPAPKANKTVAPVSAKPVGKVTPVAPAPVPVAPRANVVSAFVNADHVARASEALDKGSLKALALACAIIGLPAKASDGATKMREALADWLLANDDVGADDEQGSEPAAAVAPVAASKPAPVVKPAAPKAPARKPAAPKTVDTSSTGGLPLNQWRMLLVLDDSNDTMTYKAIDEVCQAEFGTSYYSGMTAALRDGKPDSLSDRGLISESLIEVDGRSKFAFTITAAGKALVAKHS